MTQKQKIAIAIGSGLVGAYAVIFIYQRIQRAKADASNVPIDDAIKKLREKSNVTEPKFTGEDSIPQVPNTPEETLNDNGYIPEENLTEVQKWDVVTGMGDY
jgi:hypothetical protein